MALTGRAPLIAALGAVVVLLLPSGGATLAVVVALLLLAVGADVALAASPRRLRLSRAGANSTRLGETAAVSLAIANPTGRRLRGWVRDAWPPSAGARPRAHPLDIRAGGVQRVTTELRPTRRGERRAARVTVRSVGPLGIAARQRTRAADWSVRVLPPFTSRKFLPEKLARLRELDGAIAAPQRGQGTEFDSLREYVVGDDTRSIDWRATARRSDVVVRTWRPERDRQLLLVLDTGRTSAGRVAGAPRLDAALDATLLLTALATHAGDRVALLAHDRSMRASVDAARGNRLPDVVRATAGLEPVLAETDLRAVVAQARRRLRTRSLIVLFTAVEPGAADELLPALMPLLTRHVVVVAAVADPAATLLRAGRGSADAVYAAAAAESDDAERRALVAGLRRHGVVVVEGPPDVFAPRVADAYLDLKAAGRL